MNSRIFLIMLFVCISKTFAQKDEDQLTFQTAQELYGGMKTQVQVNHTPISERISGVRNTSLLLNGNWLFSPTPATGFEKSNKAPIGWFNLFVPSEWYMKGFEVTKNTFAGYYKEFTLPTDWSRKKVYIRFGTVQSECKIYLNGQYVGDHVGAMTQFEKELTPNLKKGVNRLALYVKSESISDQSARISHYAKHQVGGILRDVTLFVEPQIHLSNLNVKVDLDETLSNAMVTIRSGLSKYRSGFEIEYIIDEYGIEGLSGHRKEVYASKREKYNCIKMIMITKPNLWHAESPFLYTLRVNLYRNGVKEQTISKRFGFRKIEIRNNSLYVNHSQVKLRGVSRHDISPYDGRALTDTAILARDIKQLRDANCNYIRTSHYPPHEYMLDLCDRYGIFVEDEAPVCWNSNPNNEASSKLLFYSFRSMLERDRSHPCILLWSIANESAWRPMFYPCLLLAEDETPEIPVKFSHSEYQGIKKRTHIGAKHYPGWQGLQLYDNYFRPMIFGEALHINCYNTSENMTDPALRDLWGEYLKYHVDEMQESPAIAGLGIWACTDELFYPKDHNPCGYGPWGVRDGFLRPKPEFWHMQMAYSPFVLMSKHFQVVNDKTFVSIENRYNFLNLNYLDIVWTDGNCRGKIKVNVEAGQQGTLVIPHVMKTDTLHLVVKDPRGFELGSWNVPRKYLPHYPMVELGKTKIPKLIEDQSTLTIVSGDVTYCFNKMTGELQSIKKKNREVVRNGVQLYLIPLLKENEVIDYIPQDNPNAQIRFTSDAMANWVLKEMHITKKEKMVEITVTGTIDCLPIEYVYKIDGEGRMRVDYLVNITHFKKEIRQLGVGLDLPREFEQLTWSRKGLWTSYPNDHIGRPNGMTLASYPETFDNYLREQRIPQHAYAKDGNQYGCNDFRSTKHNIINASLTNRLGDELLVESNGRQHIRCWINGDHISFLLACYSNGGNEHYLNWDSNRTRYSLLPNKGDVAGWFQIVIK